VSGQIDAVNNGVELGAITQNPIAIGQQVVAEAMKAIKGEQLPKTVDNTGFYWYDKNNINDPKIAPLLYH
jgi:ribose transport system substrate-binding protein